MISLLVVWLHAYVLMNFWLRPETPMNVLLYMPSVHRVRHPGVIPHLSVPINDNTFLIRTRNMFLMGQASRPLNVEVCRLFIGLAPVDRNGTMFYDISC